jgi:hypothetical protein
MTTWHNNSENIYLKSKIPKTAKNPNPKNKKLPQILTIASAELMSMEDSSPSPPQNHVENGLLVLQIYDGDDRRRALSGEREVVAAEEEDEHQTTILSRVS